MLYFNKEFVDFLNQNQVDLELSGSIFETLIFFLVFVEVRLSFS